MYLEQIGKEPMSLPAWGAWIETLGLKGSLGKVTLSLPAWGAWIETRSRDLTSQCLTSLPAWGAWIETVLDLRAKSC